MKRLIIENLTIGYRHKVIAGPLDGQIGGRELVCLIGRNGLGKSTFLRTLAGLQPALSGDVRWQDGDAVVSCRRLSNERLARVFSVVLTEQPDAMNLSVHDVVAMGRMPYTGFFGTLGKDDERMVGQALSLTGMSAFANRDISALSDGERQKIMIARAIAQHTPVMLLDEPTAFLDYESKKNTMSMLHSVAIDMDKLVLVSTHDLDIALRYADRFVTMTPDGLHELAKADVEKIVRRKPSCPFSPPRR